MGDPAQVADAMREARSSADPEQVQSVQIDRMILNALGQQYPEPVYTLALDAHQPRVLLASKWKPVPNYFGQALMKRVGREREVDLAEVEKAGAGWLQAAKAKMP